MRQIKLTTALVLVAALSFVSFGFKGCSQSEKDRNVAFARDIAGAFGAACPLVAKRLPALKGRCEQAKTDAEALIGAVAASDQASIIGLLHSVLPAFSEIVIQSNGDDSLLDGLALAQIGLNFFVNHFLSGAVALEGRASRQAGSAAPADDDPGTVIRRFKALPQFGCRLKPEKCS